MSPVVVPVERYLFMLMPTDQVQVQGGRPGDIQPPPVARPSMAPVLREGFNGMRHHQNFFLMNTPENNGWIGIPC